jgi:phosphoglycerate dehydrogenase-like enzyme
MKILIVSRNSSLPKTPVGHPHRFTKEHLDAVKKAAGKKAAVVEVSDPKAALKHASDADIIAGFPATIPPLGGAKNLKWLHSFSAGVDRVLKPEVLQSSVLVSNSSGIHRTPIAEHVIGFMLLFTRRFYQTFKNQENHIWNKDDALGELRGKTVLIVGMGEIGTEIARLVHAFGASPIAVARTRKAKPAFVDELKTAAALALLLPRADFVVAALPYTKDTHHYFAMREFKRMKRAAIIINIGRGALINESELIEALRKKIIKGAALDVTEAEPLPKESPLWDMENVIITPHHSGLSEKYMDRAIDLFCKNLSAFLNGERVATEVNKKLGY